MHDLAESKTEVVGSIVVVLDHANGKPERLSAQRLVGVGRRDGGFVAGAEFFYRDCPGWPHGVPERRVSRKYVVQWAFRVASAEIRLSLAR